tara:strand:+ start:25921 stop:26625 length:705 start_codon:yes stop_codon:yes gene_type:complete
MNYQKGNALLIVIVLIALVAGYLYFTGGEEGGSEMVKEYTVTVSNVSDAQPLSPGVLVLHTSEASLDFEGAVAPAELEPLAEYGSNTAFAELVATLPGVVEVISVDAPIMPGQQAQVSVMVDEDGLLLSGIMMAVASNDGYALLNAVELDGTEKTVAAANFDAGTEENTELGSGFEGGQPDPSQGEANVENGTATDPVAEVALHDQLTDTIMEVMVTPVVMEMDDEETEDGEEN